jgi:predicted AlkP superfamily phosphohydrolase/phosphomutase
MSQAGVKKKVLVVGLDGTPADLIFNELKEKLPNIGRIIDSGIPAILESCHPPITVPAWMVMMTGKSPGELGVYGWRQRKGFSYNEGWLASSQSIKEPKVWDLISAEHKKVCLVGVPPTYPPVKVNGSMISCSLTPKESKAFTYPPELGAKVEELLGGKYLFDVPFRIHDRGTALEKLYEMTGKRFKVINHLLETEQWDFFMFVEVGFDRLHHMFWKYYDKKHPKYEPGNNYENVIPDYYKYVDGLIGKILSVIDDETYVLLVSDHGTGSMKGAFCINEWLIKEGYLVLKDYPGTVKDLDECDVDWGKTTAWGWGGYYARIFFNIKGREANGKIPLRELDNIRGELIRKLMNIKGPNKEKLDNRVFTPEDLYDECNGSKPDLLVYFDNLFWRSAGTVGHNNVYLSENDTGPDDSVHTMEGFFVLYNKKKSSHHIKLNRLSIYEIAPIILNIMGVRSPYDTNRKIGEDLRKWLHYEIEERVAEEVKRGIR